jgi:hypothetical protein
MNLFFSDKPGAHERHVRRKVNNPLFGDLQITQDDIQSARELDEKEHQNFMTDFHALAKDASKLDASVGTDVLVTLKQRVVRCYEQSCSMMGSMDEIQQAMSQLIGSIMQALLHAANDDAPAQQDLMAELQARELHFELLGHSLIADILSADSPITSADLMPALLSAPEDAVQAVIALFNDEQLLLLCEQSHNMLDGVESDHARIKHARKMLLLLEAGKQQADDDAQSDNDSGSGSLAS